LSLHPAGGVAIHLEYAVSYRRRSSGLLREGLRPVIVAASTECFAHTPLLETFDKLADLEYSAVEIAIHEDGHQLRPSEVAANLEKAIGLCRDTHRLNLSGYSVQLAEGEHYYDQFAACCKLAKATKVATITIPSAELGTPFNEEVERLRKLVGIASMESVRVGIRSQVGRLSEDPDTVIVLCNNVKGLGLTLDPSHYICNPNGSKSFDRLIKYTYNVYLRDSTKDKLQVRIGQGDIDYGKLVAQLQREKYDRSLTAHILETDDVDHAAEMRKIRLLLESWL
jgi:sugar phosphate isomerase/epimerase